MYKSATMVTDWLQWFPFRIPKGYCNVTFQTSEATGKYTYISKYSKLLYYQSPHDFISVILRRCVPQAGIKIESKA